MDDKKMDSLGSKERFQHKRVFLHTGGAQKMCRKPLLRQFSPLMVAMVGLPGRGKSILAKRLARYMNYTGDTTKVYDISEYRRKHMKKYASHEMFRADNLPAWRIRIQSFREALEDGAAWLQQPGNKVAILDGPNVSRSQREEIYDLVYTQLGFRVMFIECVCEDPIMLERNFKEILQYSADYRGMATEESLKDLTFKMAHYKAQYVSPSLGSEWELSCPMVKLLDGGEGGVIAHGVTGVKESKILAYISTPRPFQQTLYFSRGECESLTYEELQDLFPRELALRDHEKLKYRYPQGESYIDVMNRLVPVLMQLETETNVLVVSHQAVLRCILAYFLETPLQDIPYMNVPLHTIIKVNLQGFSYNLETIKMPIECVDTNRAKPTNCSETRTAEDALKTVPAHFDNINQLVCTLEAM
ncbi:hypothetical protein HHI36_014582 [Cryptolaemus montrouzieri]|uniref:6-phosphofructo-2-kinase domain-containing protein n=1 Tax=Cryptolaemus montrouzieri TaxID=559131 RepID=A0ABD2N3F7_9CUCU